MPRDLVSIRAVREAPEPGAKMGIWLSVGVHVLGIVALLAMTVFAPKHESTVPVFELVNLNPPKLRPLRPKTVKPPEPPPPEPVREAEAPKLTTKPEKAVVPKVEPKTVKEAPDTTLKVSEHVPETAESQPQIVSHVPADPRLSFWASRVKKKAEALWNPPAGLDISGKATSVVSFKVMRDGEVVDATLTQSAGNADLDAMALQTIQRMERVPPLPENFTEDAVQVSYEFVYKGQ
jgi:periplasmic protein TonB